MTKYPYAMNTGRLRNFFARIQEQAVPRKITYQFLREAGYKSSNDRAIVGILKFIDFLDGNGVPTEKYKAYRHKAKARDVFAAALSKAYAGLFAVYSDADRKDNEALSNYFREHTGKGNLLVSYMVTTFKTLCKLADFEAARVGAPTEPELAESEALPPPLTAKALPVNVNIQITLPETKDVSIYEDIFKAMRKHLLKPEAKE